MMNLRSRLILTVIAVFAVAFVLGDFGVDRHSPPQSIRIASTENRDQPTVGNPMSVRETKSVGGASNLRRAHGTARAVQRWGLDTIWRVKHRLGM
jgi:hypothetical protein